jgi:hypothetical protein
VTTNMDPDAVDDRRGPMPVPALAADFRKIGP